MSALLGKTAARWPPGGLLHEFKFPADSHKVLEGWYGISFQHRRWASCVVRRICIVGSKDTL